MTRHITPRVGAYAGLSALGLIASLVLGLPELVAIAAPFALLVGAGLALAETPDPSVSVELERDRGIEGEELLLTLRLTTAVPIEQLDLRLAVPQGLSLADGLSPVALRLPRGERELEYRLSCDRWGSYVVGDVRLVAHDRFRVFRYERRDDFRLPLKVYPKPEFVRELLRPLETQVFTGNLVAREKGEGIEFADLRQFVAGDRVRRINWRASARRGELWVNELHAERNADVILFLDSFTEARREDGSSTLDRAVRGTAALVEHYLEHKDRVGLVSFGGVLNWLLPATGMTQLYRIVDSLLDTEIVLNYAWKDIDVIPPRTLPPKALVIALTPLLDERAARALIDLRARGFDLALVEISPVPFVVPGRLEHERLAFDIWKLRRDALRGQYERAGVPVAVWNDDVPLVAALEEVRAFRRYARPAHA